MDVLWDPFRKNVTERKWQTFCQQPQEAREGVVREFYANLKDHNDGKVRVRGKWISIESKAINKYYELPDIDDRKYRDIDNEVSIDTLTAYLCPDGTQWKSNHGDFTSFPSKDLNKKLKIWLYFVNARMMPSTHSSDVTHDRAYLLYALDWGVPINVGSMLNKEIMSFISTRSSFLFPSMITALCWKAGVKMDSDAILYPRDAIGYKSMMRIYQRETEGGKSVGMYNPDGASSSRPTASLPPPSASARPAATTTNQRVARLEVAVQNLHNDMLSNHALQLQWLQLIAEQLHIDPSRYPGRIPAIAAVAPADVRGENVHASEHGQDADAEGDGDDEDIDEHGVDAPADGDDEEEETDGDDDDDAASEEEEI